MAHEIAHVELMHGMDMMKKGESVSNTAILTMLAGLLLGSIDSQLGSAVLFGGVAGTQQAMVNYTRDNEYEADRIGMNLMQDAQFDPNGMVEFFRIMGDLSGSSELGNIEYLRTHPVSNNRVSEAASRVKNRKFNIAFDSDFLWFKDYLQYASSDHLRVQGSEYLQALAYIKAGKHAQSDRLLRDLYRRDSENIWYSIAFAENLELMGEEAQAELVYRRLLDIFPGDYILSMRLLRLLKLAGRNQSALVIARGIENRFPEDRQIYFELSEIYQSLQRPGLRLMAQAEYQRLTGNPRQAIRLYDEILSSGDIDPVTASEAREKRSILLSN
jgi:predicted Zn-dependent protease